MPLSTYGCHWGDVLPAAFGKYVSTMSRGDLSIQLRSKPRWPSWRIHAMARRQKMKIAFLLSVALLLTTISGFAQTISEETPPTTCGNRLVTGITCTGSYCDNITPICGSSAHEIYDIRWSGFVSEEGRAVASCNVSNPWERGDWPDGEPAFIAGFSCRGKYCDNVALECVALRDVFPDSLGGGSCRWTDWVSEETPTLRFSQGIAAIRMACRGRYCDEKRFFICPVRPR